MVQFLKGKFPKAYDGAKKDFMDAKDGDIEEIASPGSIFAKIAEIDDDKFYLSIEEWFKKNYPGDNLN